MVGPGQLVPATGNGLYPLRAIPESDARNPEPIRLLLKPTGIRQQNMRASKGPGNRHIGERLNGVYVCGK
jgi:hypothetical protein